ncbi:MAG: protein kinase [Myxococcota bacterium]
MDVGKVVEIVEGETLRQWLRVPRTRAEIATVMQRAGDGLQAAHDGGLVHQDLTPDCIVVCRDGSVRVTGFEASRPETAAYMAPEQFVGGRASVSTNRFAFCVVLFEALFGRRPFSGRSLLDVVDKMRKGMVVPIPPDRMLPLPLHSAIMRGLCVDPSRPGESLDALLDALAVFVDTAPPSPRRRGPRPRVVATAIAALVLSASAAIGVTLSGGADEGVQISAVAKSVAASTRLPR